MHSQAFISLDGKVQQLPQSDAEAFTTQISGGVLSSADAAYDEACKVWNGTVDRRPALIAFGRGNETLAITLLAGLPAQAHRLGGSLAQRDVLNLTLLHAIDGIRRSARRRRSPHPLEASRQLDDSGSASFASKAI